MNIRSQHVTDVKPQSQGGGVLEADAAAETVGIWNKSNSAR